MTRKIELPRHEKRYMNMVERFVAHDRDPAWIIRLKPHLEAVYRKYHHRRYVSSDPLSAVYDFDSPEDQEMAALVAATLAFGNVGQIQRSVAWVFERFPRPGADVRRLSPKVIRSRCETFRHRYVGGPELAELLCGAADVVARYGSLGAAFEASLAPGDETVLPALSRWVALLRRRARLRSNYLLPSPEKGSACKRLLLLVRWMVREDEVDLGLWRAVGSPRLVAPLDTHMHRIALALGLTRRRQADLRAALEVTAALRVIVPEDPVRYDFSLTRLGILRDAELPHFLQRCEAARGNACAPWNLACGSAKI